MTDDLLVSDASNILQSYDEWMEQCEASNHMDTGDALDYLSRMRSVVERVIETEYLQSLYERNTDES